jgi:ABC-type multidrug transport system fused ATPase/permease subunit
MGLYNNYSGEILINEKNILGYKNINSKMGIIPQENFLFADTIFNNIKMGDLEKKDSEISDHIKMLNLTDLTKKKDEGINYKLNSNGIGLSGGEKQKIAAARIMFRNPDLVIIDEGTSNLDAESEYIIYDNLFKYFKDKIIIIISHRFSNISACDSIIYLKDGEVKDIGKHDYLLNTHKEYNDLYLKQTMIRSKNSNLKNN